MTDQSQIKPAEPPRLPLLMPCDQATLLDYIVEQANRERRAKAIHEDQPSEQAVTAA